MIERNDLCVWKMSGKAPAHVSGAGAYIENGKLLIGGREIPHHPKQSMMTTEPAIDAGKVAQIPVRRRGFGILQQLCAQNTPAPVLSLTAPRMCSHSSLLMNPVYLLEVCFR